MHKYTINTNTNEIIAGRGVQTTEDHIQLIYSDKEKTKIALFEAELTDFCEEGCYKYCIYKKDSISIIPVLIAWDTTKTIGIYINPEHDKYVQTAKDKRETENKAVTDDRAKRKEKVESVLNTIGLSVDEIKQALQG